MVVVLDRIGSGSAERNDRDKLHPPPPSRYYDYRPGFYHLGRLETGEVTDQERSGIRMECERHGKEGYPWWKEVSTVWVMV